MRRVLSVGGLVACVVSLSLAPVRADVNADCEDVQLGTNSFWNGSDGSGGVASQAVRFNNQFTDWGYGYSSWAGFSCSRVSDTSTPGYGNQYAVFSGTGFGGTGQYAVAYCDSYTPVTPTVTLPVPCAVKGFYVNNTTYTALSMKNGDYFGRPFCAASNDWYRLTVTGRDAAGYATGTHDVYLADFRFADTNQNYIMADWTWVSLTNLGTTVKTLEFSLVSSVYSTPTYFAMDNLTTLESYAPEAGAPGSTAVSYSSNAFVAWATGWTNYEVGTNCYAQWQHPDNALGQADVTSVSQGTNGVVCLGESGRITLTFATPIKDGPGNDFAVFENATGGYDACFLEDAWVEVSSDGSNFYRLFNRSLAPGPIGSYDTTSPVDVTGLGCKYQSGYGEPYDLGQLAGVASNLDLQNVRFVRILDVVGNGSCTDSVGHAIYDPYPQFGSAGFDLDAVGVLSNNAEEVSAVATIPQGAKAGPWKAQFTVSRKTWCADSNLVVRLAFSGTASNGVDYAIAPTAVVIPAGKLETTVTIVPLSTSMGRGIQSVVATVLPDPTYLLSSASSATAHLVDAFPATLDAWRAQSLQVGFEDVPLGAGSYWNGSDGSGLFGSQAVRFNNQFTDWGGGFTSWAGFSCSRVNNTSTPGYGNQYAVFSGTGVGGTGQYAVAYCDAYTPVTPTITLPMPCVVRGFYVNNTTYTALSLKNGDYFGRPFCADSNDWYRLTVTGRDAAGSVTGTRDVYLADFRFADTNQDYILADWTWVSLSSFGVAVKTLEFSLASSVHSTPTYFAMDGLEIDPGSAAAGDTADWNGDGTPNLLAYALGYDMSARVSGPMTLAIAHTNGQSYVEVQYARRHGLADATLTPTYTTSLMGGAWLGGAGHVEERIVASGTTVDTIRARLLDSATNAVGFVRLGVTRP